MVNNTFIVWSMIPVEFYDVDKGLKIQKLWQWDYDFE